mgnify:CR=1 FL=1
MKLGDKVKVLANAKRDGRIVPSRGMTGVIVDKFITLIGDTFFLVNFDHPEQLDANDMHDGNRLCSFPTATCLFYEDADLEVI